MLGLKNSPNFALGCVSPIDGSVTQVRLIRYGMELWMLRSINLYTARRVVPIHLSYTPINSIDHNGAFDYAPTGAYRHSRPNKANRLLALPPVNSTICLNPTLDYRRPRGLLNFALRATLVPTPNWGSLVRYVAWGIFWKYLLNLTMFYDWGRLIKSLLMVISAFQNFVPWMRCFCLIVSFSTRQYYLRP